MIIPETIVLLGDRDKAQMWQNTAKLQLAILRRQLELGEIETGFRTIKPMPGVVIECWASRGLSQIRITVGEAESRLPTMKTEFPGYKCDSYMCFSVGYIIGPSANVDMDSEDRRYDVLLCKLQTYYARINYCNTSDWAEYEDGEQVLVSTKWNTAPCCDNPPASAFDGYVITPIVSNHPRWRTAN